MLYVGINSMRPRPSGRVTSRLLAVGISTAELQILNAIVPLSARYSDARDRSPSCMERNIPVERGWEDAAQSGFCIEWRMTKVPK